MEDNLWGDIEGVEVVEVLLYVEIPGIEQTYSYLVPEHLKGFLHPGQCLHVQFNGRDALGIALSRKTIENDNPLVRKLKPVLGVVSDAPELDDEQIHLLHWLSEEYVCDLHTALRCVAPSSHGARMVIKVSFANSELISADLESSLSQAHLIEILNGMGGSAEKDALKKTANLPAFQSAYSSLIKRGLLLEERYIERTGATSKTVRGISLGETTGILTENSRRTPQQSAILNVITEWFKNRVTPMPALKLLEMSGSSAACLRGLIQKGVLNQTQIPERRNPVKSENISSEAPALTSDQKIAIDRILEGLKRGESETILLYGVTASGKTEVYLHAIEYALSIGKGAMVLLPEIALTAQVADAFVARFGDLVALFHSKLSEGERYDEWQRLRSGEACIVVGARSALFAPLKNLSLIIMDEEHETSYKQEKMPRYNTKDVARERARRTGALLVLGSATPSLESYSVSENDVETSADKSITRIEMLHRVNQRPMPLVHVVDMRADFKQNHALFSQKLLEGITERLLRKEQIILFLNRRGYSQFVLCRDCGWTARCPSCAVSLTYHMRNRLLRCHHCDHKQASPETCPECGGAKVRGFGIGTEKVELEAQSLFPEAKIVRMDRDTTSRRGEHAHLVRSFRRGESDVLIGTQMVAKGLDFPRVTLVGVISADTTLNMPDFRAAERTFQLLTQVSGRAGRGALTGEVVVQTFTPDHYSIQTALNHDYPSFYEQEIVYRRELKYPPFSRLANLICSSDKPEISMDTAQKLADLIRSRVDSTTEIIGPSPAPIAMLKNMHRAHLALRGSLQSPLADSIRYALGELSLDQRLSITVDIDPMSML